MDGFARAAQLGVGLSPFKIARAPIRHGERVMNQRRVLVDGESLFEIIDGATVVPAWRAQHAPGRTAREPNEVAARTPSSAAVPLQPAVPDQVRVAEPDERGDGIRLELKRALEPDDGICRFAPKSIQVRQKIRPPDFRGIERLGVQQIRLGRLTVLGSQQQRSHLPMRFSENDIRNSSVLSRRVEQRR